MITIAETGPFQRKATALFAPEEKQDLIAYLAAHPTTGVIIQGTNGIRKIRWSRGNRGKSAGVRVIYYYHNEDMPLYLLALFSKNEKANLSAQERNQLAALVTDLVAYWRHHHEQRLH